MLKYLWLCLLYSHDIFHNENEHIRAFLKQTHTLCYSRVLTACPFILFKAVGDAIKVYFNRLQICVQIIGKALKCFDL